HCAQPISSRRAQSCAKSAGLNSCKLSELGRVIVMRRVVAAITAALLLGFAGPAVAQTIGDEIQNEEQPGSEIQINLGGGEVQVERKNSAPIFPLAPFRRPAFVFPSAPYTAPAPFFPVAPLAGKTRAANDSVFPVAPLPLGSNQLRPL